MAEVLGELGAKVAITARKAHELDAAAKHLKSLGIEALPVVCDMGDLAAIPALVDSVIAELGPIDILVNNAGTSWGAPTIEHPLDALEQGDHAQRHRDLRRDAGGRPALHGAAAIAAR